MITEIKIEIIHDMTEEEKKAVLRLIQDLVKEVLPLTAGFNFDSREIKGFV